MSLKLIPAVLALVLASSLASGAGVADPAHKPGEPAKTTRSVLFGKPEPDAQPLQVWGANARASALSLGRVNSATSGIHERNLLSGMAAGCPARATMSRTDSSCSRYCEGHRLTGNWTRASKLVALEGSFPIIRLKVVSCSHA